MPQLSNAATLLVLWPQTLFRMPQLSNAATFHDTQGHFCCLLRCHCYLPWLALRSRTAAFGEGSQHLLGADAVFVFGISELFTFCAKSALETLGPVLQIYIQQTAHLLSFRVSVKSRMLALRVGRPHPPPRTGQCFQFSKSLLKPCRVHRIGASMPGVGCEKAMAVVKGLRETVESCLAEIKADPATGMHGSVEASSGLAIDIDDEDDVQEIESLQVESADEKDDEAPGQSAVESIRELVVCSSEEDYWCRQ
eukprot:s8709_g1.t1